MLIKQELFELTKGKKAHTIAFRIKPTTPVTGWRRMKEIANKSMVTGSYNVSDVRQELSRMRNEQSEC